MSRQNVPIEQRVAEALERMVKAQEAVAKTNAAHLELSRRSDARSKESYERALALQDDAIRRSIEMHETLMERHAQVTEMHELQMAAAGARAPDYIPKEAA